MYKEAAFAPDVGLCCTTNPVWQFPGLSIPDIMLEMNYGCGSTVSAQDLVNDPKVLYVGVGGGMELLQFAYFSRQKGGVTGVDVVDEMLAASRENLKLAEQTNDWFKSEYVNLVKGNATVLAPGMCFSNEPMICIYGEFGVRLEDHVYMTETGPAWFTQPSHSIDDPFGYEA